MYGGISVSLLDRGGCDTISACRGWDCGGGGCGLDEGFGGLGLSYIGLPELEGRPCDSLPLQISYFQLVNLE